jgi:hypothetical protein
VPKIRISESTIDICLPIHNSQNSIIASFTKD